MGNLYLSKTEKTPEVDLSIENHNFEIKGSSYSDSAFEDVYSKVFIWIDEEMPGLNDELNCVFFFRIMNSVSYKNIMQIMIKLVNFYNLGKKLTITWFFEGDDEDNEELAQDMSSIFDIPFIIEAI